MDLALLRTFVTVHRAGSFTRAAQLLGLSQPAVTGQIRTLERQVGRPLFLRLPRGVAPTTVGDELAHKVAPHLDALLEITAAAPDEDGPGAHSLHLAGPSEFTALRILPALAPLVADGLHLRVSLSGDDEALAGLAAGHHDLAVVSVQPRDRLIAAVPLWDEEYALVTSPRWLEQSGGPHGVRDHGPQLLDDLPVVTCDEECRLLSQYWAAVFDARPTRNPAVVVPDLRAVLDCVRDGVGLAVLPRYLCAAALAAGEITLLLEPPVPPLRTYFLATRAGTLALPRLARAHERLLTAAQDW
ncbi:LysR family transcriptional regulator [Streptomyces sp. SPB162]|uniref:LysR family transcriptional regulator n=1 Tax=Streptomyces sp. SPB162 TaxID=2940560 RepID=UPI0024074D9D|nr:LysR family transcriptional regulator [Streptomyces sp. SPB162]MDF9814341.1 DNA-binding transcriptional LysR family regulator [Streptomyces sp. SPB162]